MSEQEATLDEFMDSNTEKLDLGPRTLRLPEQWDNTRFGDAFSHQRGVNYSSDNYVSEGDGMIFLTLNAIAPGGGLKKDSLKFYDDDIPEEKTTTAGDILMANTDLNQDGEIIGYPVRVPSFDSDQKKCFSHHLLKIQQKENIYNSHFLEYLLSAKYIHDRMIAFSCGSTVLNLNTGLLEKLELPVPLLEEQRKVASVLYTVDQAIQKTDEIIDQTERVKKGVMQDLYGEGIGHNNFIETEFGKMPDTWDLEKIEDVCEIGGGGTPNKSNPDYWGGDILWTTPKDFDTPRMTDTEDHLTEEGAEEATSDIYQPGSTMLVVRSGILRRKLPVAKIITPTTVNQDLKVLQPISGLIEPDYLFQIIYTHSERIRGRCKKMGTTVESIETDMLKKYRLKIPPLEEQKRIAEIGETFDDKIQSNKENLDQLQRLKQGLMQDLLSGEVRTHDKDIELVDEVLQHG